jgi:hypothetical protein
MDLLWLGYDGLSVRYIDVAAVLFYHPSLDGRVVTSYGVVPARVQAVIVTSDGAFFPSRWSVDELRTRLIHWRNSDAPGDHSPTS